MLFIGINPLNVLGDFDVKFFLQSDIGGIEYPREIYNSENFRKDKI